MIDNDNDNMLKCLDIYMYCIKTDIYVYICVCIQHTYICIVYRHTTFVSKVLRRDYV